MPLLPLPAHGPVAAQVAPAPPAVAGALSCLPAGITRGAKVVALGVYGASGGRSLPFILAGSNNNIVHSLTVTGHGDEPVVLVVAAYDPILWDLSAVAGRVKAVVASGYYPQAVRGIPADVPVRFSSMVGTFNGSETCARIHYAYEDGKEIQTMARDIRRAIGVYPNIFYGNYSVERLDMDGPGTAAGVPDLTDIRAGVPLITEDDPASKAQMKTLPSAEEQATAGPRLRIMAWDPSGKVTRDEGGREPKLTGTSAARVAMTEPATRTSPRGSAVRALLLWLAAIGAVIYTARRWGRSKPAAAGPVVTRARAPIPAVTPPLDQPAAPPPSRFQKQIADLSALAAITDCEPLVVALHRYGREVQNVARTSFDPDLADEVDAIIDRHFDHAIERYRQVRTSLNETEGQRADEMLTRAVERLALRLQELQTEQHHRFVDGIDEAARFIDARHPV